MTLRLPSDSLHQGSTVLHREVKRSGMDVDPAMTTSVDELLERTQWDLFWVPDHVRIVDRILLADSRS